jgi:8-oxo-dGTP pyrophosphatase MutT (NUDIX family)
MGEMGQHTANAGRIYFPSGTPDLGDVRGGALDIPGSVVREIAEETGLTADDYAVEADWHCVVSGRAIAMIQILNLDMRGDEARARIEANLARDDEPELSAIHLVRDMGDLRPSMPRFVTAFVERQFASR